MREGRKRDTEMSKSTLFNLHGKMNYSRDVDEDLVYFVSETLYRKLRSRVKGLEIYEIPVLVEMRKLFG